MRYGTSTLALAALLTLGPAGVHAADSQHQLTGEIARLDTMARTVSVRESAKPGREETFVLTSNAKIMAGSQTKRLGDLEAGDRIRVRYRDQGKQHLADQIQLLPAQPSSTPVEP